MRIVLPVLAASVEMSSRSKSSAHRDLSGIEKEAYDDVTGMLTEIVQLRISG
jgi:hypothetical protein